jgi:hypothetical protein
MTPRPCVLCGFDLAPVELQTCQVCVGLVRLDLTQIEHCYALLPGLLGAPDGASLGAVMGGLSGEAALPGGDVLAMLGPGAEHGEGDPADPPAVAFELGWWAGDWWMVRGESGAVPADVPGLVAWLGTRLGWAMSHHPAAAYFAADMARIRGFLEAATSMVNTPERGATCPYCGATLLRAYEDTGRRCAHRAPDWRLGTVSLPRGYAGPERLETVADRDVRIAAWELEHSRCNVGGRVDDWSCPRCRRVFNDAQYRLAWRAALEGEAVGG